MAIAHVASVKSATATSSAIDTTGATLIVIAVAEYQVNAGTASFTDSKGNTYTALAAQNDGVGRGTLFYCANPVVGTGHTFTYATVGTPTYFSFAAAAYSGVKTASPLDQQNGAVSLDPAQTGSVTPSEDNEIVVAICGYWNGGLEVSIDSGFTIRQQVAYTGGSNFGIALADLVQTTAGAVNPTFTEASLHASMVIATFKQGATSRTAQWYYWG